MFIVFLITVTPRSLTCASVDLRCNLVARSRLGTLQAVGEFDRKTPSTLVADEHGLILHVQRAKCILNLLGNF
jgi:hypothetical protein